MKRLFFILTLFLSGCNSAIVTTHPYKMPYYFNTLDIDKDGFLSFEEWYHGMYEERMWFYAKCDFGSDGRIYLSDAAACGMNEDAFSYYDRNKDAFISPEEFKTLQPKAYFDFVDSNKDGKISVSEYHRVSMYSDDYVK